ncbi:hypothetical protein ACPEEZ_02880 [Frigoribacterium sp. 2-23]|uniref:hypothetical protein n=1 Tax=Frigoribacterium sp. 2-23 TaxID=3415006 RepID=UPI003C6F3A2F
MADLIVDGDALATSIDNLARVRDELADQMSGRDENHDIFGQRDINKAMRDFSGDWKIHRKKIKDDVAKLHDKLVEMNDTWNEADQEIKKNIQTETV